MGIDKITSIIQDELSKNEDEFFSYAWREKLGEMLKEESKYCRLIEWINGELEQCKVGINVFCPADKQEDYTKQYANTYLLSMQKFAVLLHFRALLLDRRTTIKMRENIEYTLCKLYGIHYSEELNCYV